jgi:GPH family glycoside/pentoside/hexuronide:cation symporter
MDECMKPNLVAAAVADDRAVLLARSKRPMTIRAGAKKLATGRLIAFSALAMPIYAVQVPLGFYLPAIFTQYYSLSLTVIGMIYLLEKLWGTLADPIIGSLSDRTQNPLGRRRSWILAGGATFGLAGLFLFFPPATVGPTYLAITLFVFYLGWSMIQIPFFAWSGEISGDHDERTRVATYQTVGGSIALLLVLVLPTIIDQLRPGDGALKLNAMGGLILATLVAGLPLTLRAFPEPPLPDQPAHRSTVARRRCRTRTEAETVRWPTCGSRM